MILIVAITKDRIVPEAYDSTLAQLAYPDVEMMTYISPAREYAVRENKNSERMINLYCNCSDNRNKARLAALATRANAFLFVDSDIVLPADAISRLALWNKPVVGGYYEIAPKRFAAGKFVENANKQSVFLNCGEPVPGLFKADMVGLGCALVRRPVLEKVGFRHGLDQFCLGGELESPVAMAYGECIAFGSDAAALKFDLFMDGAVVCKHLRCG